MTSVVAGNPAQSILYTQVVGGLMPLGGSPLSTADTQLISAWIAAGALNN